MRKANLRVRQHLARGQEKGQNIAGLESELPASPTPYHFLGTPREEMGPAGTGWRSPRLSVHGVGLAASWRR